MTTHGNKRVPFLVLKAGVFLHKHVHKENESKRHGFGVRLWKELAPLQAKHDCQIYGNRTAWWNSEISVKFLDYYFGHRYNMHQRILLLWDEFSGHWTEEVTQYAASINVVLLKVLPRYT
ncbi:hypothetical protein DVH05_017012 [Phytophthora capsici]|nr:hypothetical protein DVH05_017012 [Phytophthora capsici]